MITENCVFHSPYYFDLATKTILPFDGENANSSWEFGASSCTTTDERIEFVQSTTSEFYLDKSVSYGDFLLIFFLFLFTGFIIFNFIFKFIFKQKVSFRNQ